MPTYKVYYWRDPITLIEPDIVTGEKLPDTHRYVASVEGATPDEVFAALQDPPPVQADAIAAKSGSHTSMSVGDVLEAPDGTMLVCMNIGWRKLRPAPSSVNDADSAHSA